MGVDHERPELPLLRCLRPLLRSSLGLGVARPAGAAHADARRRDRACSAALLLLALIAPLLGDPYATPIDGLTLGGACRTASVSDGHLLGTDALGRDMLARAAHGARTSLEIALIANITSVALGTIVGRARRLPPRLGRAGADAGDRRLPGHPDASPRPRPRQHRRHGRAAASSSSSPRSTGRGPRAWSSARRCALRRRAFVEAAVAQGVGVGAPSSAATSSPTSRRCCSPSPRSTAPRSSPIGTGLSYLGAGIQPPEPEWGNMLFEGQDALDYAPHLLLVPLACIVARGLRLRADRPRRSPGAATSACGGHGSISDDPRRCSGCSRSLGVVVLTFVAAGAGARRPRAPRSPGRAPTPRRSRSCARTCTSTTRCWCSSWTLRRPRGPGRPRRLLRPAREPVDDLMLERLPRPRRAGARAG